MPSAPLPEPDSVRLLVERIAASKRFSHAPQQVQFLKFTVEEALCGRCAALKEYYIATEAFSRGPDFDPKVDTIVRVQAGNVRAKLKEYFETEGRHERILIDYPVGTYVPEFRFREETAAEPAKPHRQPWWKAGTARWAAAGVVVLLVAMGVRATWSRREPPPVDVVQLTFDTGFTSDPSVSRDGKLIAYYSDRAEFGNLDIWVQPRDGSGPARRLTRDPARDMTPDISPDALSVAFRSDRDGGGIYVVSTTGGEALKIADLGYSPRFSPDSAWIAYAARTQTGRTAAFIVPASGGKSIDLRPESPHSARPVWSPEGGHVIFISANTPEETSYDWWVAPVDSHGAPQVKPAVRTGAAALLARQGLGTMDGLFGPSDWYGDSILFTAPQQSQIWELPLSRRTLQVAGAVRQVLSGPTAAYPRAFRDDGRLLLFFNSGVRLNNIWSLGTSSAPTQLTSDTSLLPGVQTRFSLSPDGAKLLFPSRRSGAWKIWQKDLATGQEASVTQGQADSDPLYAPAGLRFAFMRAENGRRSLYVSTGAADRKLSTNSGRPVSWTPDETALLCIGGKAIWLVETATGKRKRLFHRAGWTPMEAALSPDGRWLAIAVDHGKQKLQGYLARFGAAGLADPSDWIWVTEEPFNLTFAWAADGTDLYHFHSRDGFRCLWSQRVEDLQRGRRAAPPRSIRHFHSFQDYPLNGSALSVAGNRVAVVLAQHRSNLWRASVRPR
jgi:Tol biopolymer transport system component